MREPALHTVPQGAATNVNRHMRAVVLRYSIWNRRRKAAYIQDFMEKSGLRTAILVGCSPGRNANEGIVENAVADRADILAACDVLVSRVAWPFVLADGRALPFRNRAADLVVANAVIEHVGSLNDQVAFVDEQSRVGHAWVITTPNRWFPVESHTSTVLKHWSSSWRSSRREFTRLLSKREFTDLLPSGAKVRGYFWSPTFIATYVSPTNSMR